MDVLELPRPVINFLRTISKEMNRYSLCWDIYGGSESVTLTLTWKINCDESDDEQLAKSRRQHQQQLNNLINMDLNSNIFTDNTSSSSNMNSTNVLNTKTNAKQQTPSTPTSKTKQLQHSKLDKLVGQSSTSSNNCLFSSSSKNKQSNDPIQSGDSYDPYVDTKSKRNAFIQQQNKLISRNYSAESNVFNTKYEEDLKEQASNQYFASSRLHQHQQHKSRRPKSSNHSLERVSSHQMSKENEKIYLDFNRAQSTNLSDNDNDDDDLYDKQPVVKNVYPKKILKYTRGKSLENFDHSMNDHQYENFEHHRYCQNCSHGNNNNNNNANQMSFLNNNNRLYQQSLPLSPPQQQYISRSDQTYFNPQQMYQPPLQHQQQQQQQQYMLQSNHQQLPMHQQLPLPPPQQQYSNFNSNFIKISSNTSGGNNEKVCLNNQRILLDTFNPYQQSFSYQQQQQPQPQPQQNYMQSNKPQVNYVQDFDQSDIQKQQQNYFKTTKQKSIPPSSNDLNRIVYSQTAMSKAATCSHPSNNNNSSNTENNTDSSSSENLINAAASIKKALPPNPNESICINSSSNFANSTISNNNNNNNNNAKTVSSNLASSSVSSTINNNPWIRRNILTETKENIVSESTFSKMSTTNEVTDTNFEYNNSSSSNSNNNTNTNNDFHSTNVSLPIKNAQQSNASNAINMSNTNSNANNTSNNSSMHRVTFDPKLDK